MKKIDISLVISLLLPCALFAQAPDTTSINTRALFPGSGSSAPDTLTVPKDFVTEPGSFQQGKGAEVDTLDIQDGRLLLVLKDDHTWYYIKNFKRMESDSTFVKDWLPNSTNPYTAPLESLPLHNAVALVDSASRFVVPYQTKVFSRFGIRRGRRHQGVDLPLKTGTPVVAAFDGRVRASTYSKGYGNLVIIRHENGLETFYGHLSKREVEVGARICTSRPATRAMPSIPSGSPTTRRASCARTSSCCAAATLTPIPATRRSRSTKRKKSTPTRSASSRRRSASPPSGPPSATTLSRTARA